MIMQETDDADVEEEHGDRIVEETEDEDGVNPVRTTTHEKEDVRWKFLALQVDIEHSSEGSHV